MDATACLSYLSHQHEITPKHDSLLNHLRSYIPEIYPHLEKVVYLDDDVIVQKDLTPLFSLDLHGNINGAVETCLEAFHRLYKYLNFSNPVLSSKIDPQGCGWVFRLNIIDLVAWRNTNVTGLYHYWDEHNADGNLWKLGTSPASLLAFYGRRSWDVVGSSKNPNSVSLLVLLAFFIFCYSVLRVCSVRLSIVAARCSVWFNSTVSDRLLWLQLRFFPV
ncbi:probable galacturonosyltransferase 11 [Tanacetum coccineum]